MAEVGATFDEFVEGGFGFDDVDVTCNTARFIQWDYKGKIPQPVLGLSLNMVDQDGREGEEVLSAGELRFFVPSSDGKKAIPVGQQTKLNVNTNAVAFIISLMNADKRGELTAKLKSGDDISVLDGLKFHAVRKAQPKRPGISALPTDPNVKERDKTQLICESIIAYPWEAAPAAGAKPAAAAAARPAATAAAPAAAAVSSDIENQALGLLISLIAENGNMLKVSAIAGKVFSNAEMKAAPIPVRNAVLGLIVQPAFLGAEGRPWSYDKAAGTVSLG